MTVHHLRRLDLRPSRRSRNLLIESKINYTCTGHKNVMENLPDLAPESHEFKRLLIDDVFDSKLR